MSHVEGHVDPVRDLDIIHEELRLKDIEYAEKEWDKLHKLAVRGGDKKQIPVYECLTKVKEMLTTERKNVRFGDWSQTEVCY